MKTKKLISILITICIAAGLVSCGNLNVTTSGKEKYSDTYFDAFDTVIIFTAYCNSKDEFTKMSSEVKDLYLYYHKLFDIYNNYDGMNNAKTLNDNAGIAPVKLDEPFLDLIDFSKDLYKQTDGNVNIAFGSVLKYWHNVREAVNNGEKAELPLVEDLQAANLHCNIDDIIVDRENGTVFLADPLMSVDLGSVAKGYATELVADKLLAEGKTNIIISAGGNTRSVGLKPGDEKWSVGIQNPDAASSQFAEIIEIGSCSVVTSGTYERFFELDGVRYHHIINKDTLKPENNFQSVSIVTEDSAYADALSTAVFNMTLEDGKRFISEQKHTEAMWMLNDNSKVYSDGFEALIR